VDAIDPVTGWTALHLAAANGFGGTAGLLLAEGAKASRLDSQGRTPLMLAAMEGSVDVLDTLAASSESFDRTCDLRDHQGCTALWHASFRGHADAVSLLLEENVDPDICSHFGQSPRDAARLAGREECARLLEVGDRVCTTSRN
jgi:uncharacterized protein